MANLDDRILKKNIPGKYSWWDEYNDTSERRHEEDDVDGDHDGRPYNADHQTKTWNNTRPIQMSAVGTRNTGAKAVLSDYKIAKQMEAYEAALEQEDRSKALKRATNGAQLKPGEYSISEASIQARKREQNAQFERKFGGDDGSDDSDKDSIDDDDEFLKLYRQQRILQLHQQASNWPEYGELKEVNAIEFSDIIDDTDPRVFCIFHLYEPSIGSCNLLNNHLELLAREMSYCRIFRLRASIAKKNFDPVGLPCVLIYRAGTLEANLTPITEHLSCSSSGRFTADDVELLFESCGVVDQRSTKVKPSLTSSQEVVPKINERDNHGYSKSTDEYDSDDAELDEFCAGFDMRLGA